MEDKIPMKDVIVMRQEFKVSDAFPGNHFNPGAIFDYLTIYSPGGEILHRSIGHGKDVDIKIVYRDLEFISRPGYTSDLISVSFDSLLNFVNKE